MGGQGLRFEAPTAFRTVERCHKITSSLEPIREVIMIASQMYLRARTVGLLIACLGTILPQAAGSDRMPYDPQLATKTVKFWEERTKRDDLGFIEWRELSAAYLARQRETGDIADAVKAEEAARRSLQIQGRKNAAAWTRLGRSLLTQHRFPEALEAAERAAALDTSANRLVADIQIELGDLDRAERALAADPSRGHDLNSLALGARLDQARGRQTAALRKLQEACAIVANRPDMPAEAVAWTHTMLGHMLIDSGQLEAGEKACREAIAVFPNDYRAMTGLAEAAAWREDWKAVARWAKTAIEISPQNPEAIRLLGESHAKLGDSRAANEQYQRLEDLCKSFPRIYDRHWILLCADQRQDLDRALLLARKDLELRKDAGAYDTLAWICLKSGLLPEAERCIVKAIAPGSQSAPIYYHAGMIAEAAGDKDRSASFFDQARALNRYLMKRLTAN
jgi:thioredoxin-like negative regulator of GroEL